MINNLKYILFCLVLILFIVPGKSYIAYSQNSQQQRLISPQVTNNRSVSQEISDDDRKRIGQLYSAARRLEARQQNLDAYHIYMELNEFAPEKNEYYDGLRRTLLAMQRYEEAILLIQERSKNYKRLFSPVKAEAQLGEVYYLMGEKEKAAHHWAIALDKEPHSSNSYQVVASTMARLRLLDDAVSVFERGRHFVSDKDLFALNLATLHQARMDWLNATREYLNTLKVSSNRLNFVRRGLASFPETKEADNAIQIIVEQELKESEGKSYWQGYQMALREIIVDNYKKRGNFLSALEHVEKIKISDKDLGEKLLKFAGECLEESQDSVAVLALAKASEFLKDAEGVAIINLTLADIETKYSNYKKADSLLTSLLEQHPRGMIRQLVLYKRGINHLYGLNDFDSAIVDMKNVLNENRQENENEITYHLSIALAKAGKPNEALATLRDVRGVVNRGKNRYLPEFSRYEQANPVLLASRISLWTGDQGLATTLLDSLVSMPKGVDAENEALELLYLYSTTEDSLLLERFAVADRDEFQGNLKEARAAFELLSASEDSTIAIESDWRKTKIDLQMGSEVALDSFMVAHPSHPKSELAVFLKAGLLLNKGEIEATIHLYEDYLFNSPDGVLTSLARRKLDELKALQVANNSNNQN